VSWMWSLISDRLTSSIREHGNVAPLLPELENAVRHGSRMPGAAADEILKVYWSS